MTMTVEKSTADDVRKKFEELKKDKDQPMPVDSVLDGMPSSCFQHGHTTKQHGPSQISSTLLVRHMRSNLNKANTFLLI